jgi:hypothetical protein
MAKAPRPRAAEGEGDTKHLTLVIDGERYSLRLDELSAHDTGLFRKATGISLRFALDALSTDPDIDIVAALVWLSERQAGRTKSYSDLAKKIGYNIDLDVEKGVDEGDDEDPQR